MVEKGGESASQKIGVLFCRCEGEIADKVDLTKVYDRLRNKHPAVIMKISDALCKRPNEIGAFIKHNNTTNIIMGACSKYRELFEETSTKANLKPFRLKTVSLLERCALIHSTEDATEKAKIMFFAAVSRERRFEGVATENLKPTITPLDRKMDRRSFLTFPIKFRHQIIPTIDADQCVGWRGCNICVEACPKHAFSKQGQKIQINISKCEGCGICMVTCPKRAIFFPTHSPHQMDEEVRTLVSADADVLKPRIILFACAGGKSLVDKLGSVGLSHPANIMVVEVPCLGMVAPFFMLRALELGAEAVGLVPCQTKCRYEYDLNQMHENVQASKELLKIFGIDPKRICTIAQSYGDLYGFHVQLKIFSEKVLQLGPNPLRGKEPSELDRSWSNLSYMVKHIGDELGIDRTVRVCSSSLPFRIIRVEADKCSMCELCVDYCPTEAISLKCEEGHVTLLFDYSLCTACGICLKHCPESAMLGERVLDMRKLDAPISILVEDKMTVCKMCGATFLPEKQIKVVLNRIFDKSDNYTRMISSYCPNCRIKA